MNNFAVLDISYVHTTTEIIISLTTNAPCHLTCYYTDKKPLKHPLERTVRGLTVPWGTYFCFVAWQSVKQTEPGDTLTHTFTIPNLVYCQTIWHTVRGTVGGVLSPSVGPIFSRHFVPWITLELATIKDTYIWSFNKNANYGNNDNLLVSAYPPHFTHTISFLAFDQSSVPAGATIHSATLRLYYTLNTAEGNTHIAYKLLYDDWVEMELNYRQYKAGSPWAVAGLFSPADYETTDPPGSPAIVPPFGAPFYVEWDLATLLIDAISNGVNLNLTLMGISPETGIVWYRSKENPNIPLRPELTIIYSIP